MLSGMFMLAESNAGTFGVGGVGPVMRCVSFFAPSAQIEMSHFALKTPGSHAPQIAQKLRSISPLSVVELPPRFQAQLGSTGLRSTLSLSAEFEFQIAAGPENSVELLFKNGPPHVSMSAGAVPAQGT